MAPAQTGAALTADGVNFVNKNNTRAVLLRLIEKIADAARPDPNEHLDKFRTRYREERNARLPGDRLRQQRFTGPRRTDKKDALRNPRAKRNKFLRFFQEIDDLVLQISKLNYSS